MLPLLHRSGMCGPILSVCNVNLVDGLVWNQEAVGSNPTTQTNLNGRRRWSAAEIYKLWRLARWAGTAGIVTLVYYQILPLPMEWCQDF